MYVDEVPARLGYRTEPYAKTPLPWLCAGDCLVSVADPQRPGQIRPREAGVDDSLTVAAIFWNCLGEGDERVTAKAIQNMEFVLTALNLFPTVVSAFRGLMSADPEKHREQALKVMDMLDVCHPRPNI